MKGIVETTGGVVERLSISSVEKRRLERNLYQLVCGRPY